jgi:hypothetical protein
MGGILVVVLSLSIPGIVRSLRFRAAIGLGIEDRLLRRRFRLKFGNGL